MITVNGKERAFVEGQTVQDIIDEVVQVHKQFVAVVNGEPIPANRYSDTLVKDGDDIKVHLIFHGG